MLRWIKESEGRYALEDTNIVLDCHMHIHGDKTRGWGNYDIYNDGQLIDTRKELIDARKRAYEILGITKDHLDLARLVNRREQIDKEIEILKSKISGGK